MAKRAERSRGAPVLIPTSTLARGPSGTHCHQVVVLSVGTNDHGHQRPAATSDGVAPAGEDRLGPPGRCQTEPHPLRRQGRTGVMDFLRHGKPGACPAKPDAEAHYSLENVATQGPGLQIGQSGRPQPTACWHGRHTLRLGSHPPRMPNSQPGAHHSRCTPRSDGGRCCWSTTSQTLAHRG